MIAQSLQLPASLSGANAHVRARTYARPARAAMVCRAEAVNRRNTLMGVAAGVAALISASPVQAGLFDGGAKAQEQFAQETTSLAVKAYDACHMARDDPKLVDAVTDVRKDINTYISKYRRDSRFSGKPSFTNLYSAVNALAGHYNSYGPEVPVPRKRLDRLSQELKLAERFAKQGR